MIEGSVNEDNEPVVSLVDKGPAGQITIDAVVDTGFSDALTLPDLALSELGLVPIDRARIRLADGSITYAKLYESHILWAGRWKRVLIQGANSTPLLGANLLVGMS